MTAADRQQAGPIERARVAMAQGAWYEAQRLLRECIASNPTSVELLQYLGLTLVKLRLWEDAATTYEQALALAPADLESRLGLAYAVRAAGRTNDAAGALESALEQRPDSVPCIHDLAVLRLELGELEEACRLLTHALSLNPRHAGLYTSLAQLNVIRGKLDDAAWCAAKALECDPDYTPAMLRLTELKPESPLLDAERLETRLQTDVLSDEDRRNLGFAAGRLRHQRGDYRKAFASFKAGNEAHCRIVERVTGPYDRLAREQQVERLARIYSRQAIAALSPAGLETTQPIFVVGMTRSGTTLVEQILSRHPAVHGAGERAALALVRDRFERVAIGSNGMLVRAMPRRLVEPIAQHYFDGLPGEATASRYFVDKNPHNFWLIGLIMILYPNARIVHCRRDPVETCFSNYLQIFSPHHNYSNRLEDIGHYYNQYRRIMEHWRCCGSGNLFELRYEALIENPEAVVRALLQHLQLEWHEDCLEPHRSSRPVFTPSQVQVRKPFYTTSIGRWRHYEPELKGLIEDLESASP